MQGLIFASRKPTNAVEIALNLGSFCSKGDLSKDTYTGRLTLENQTRSSHCGAVKSVVSWECWDAGSMPSLVQWIGDPVLLQMWLRSWLWLGFDLWPKKEKIIIFKKWTSPNPGIIHTDPNGLDSWLSQTSRQGTRRIIRQVQPLPPGNCRTLRKHEVHLNMAFGFWVVTFMNCPLKE